MTKKRSKEKHKAILLDSIPNRNIQITVCASIYDLDTDKYRFVKEKKGPHKGKWSFPKGAVERGESEYGATIREVLEETGFVGDLHEESTHYWIDLRPWNGHDRKYVVREFTPRKRLDSGDLENKEFSAQEVHQLGLEGKLFSLQVLDVIKHHQSLLTSYK